MHALSLKVEEDIFADIERIVKKRKIPRNAYINEALRAYNSLIRRRELAEQLRAESGMVNLSSLETLNELEKLADLNEN